MICIWAMALAMSNAKSADIAPRRRASSATSNYQSRMSLRIRQQMSLSKRPSSSISARRH